MEDNFTQAEKEFVAEGCNWIGKLGRHFKIKALRHYGYTLDEVLKLPEEEQEKIWEEARIKWNVDCKR